MILQLYIKFVTREPNISSHHCKYSSHCRGCLRENLERRVWSEMNRRSRMKPREQHLTGGWERTSKVGNWKCLVRDVRKHNFPLKWAFVHWLSHSTTFTVCLPHARHLLELGIKLFTRKTYFLLVKSLHKRRNVHLQENEFKFGESQVEWKIKRSIYKYKQTRQENRGF